MTMDLPRYILIEGDGPTDDRFHVATFGTAARPLVSRVVVYRLLHRQPISRSQAESAIVDLNRGGSGRGPTRIPDEPDAPDAQPAPGGDVPANAGR
jgi:hypothetical protein